MAQFIQPAGLIVKTIWDFYFRHFLHLASGLWLLAFLNVARIGLANCQPATSSAESKQADRSHSAY
jgi:hypothetical protein